MPRKNKFPRMTDTNPQVPNLLEKLIEGDEEAYLLLVETYYRKLLVYAYSLTNDYAVSQDIVQNVFLRIWELRKNLNIKKSLKGFLYRSVYNEFVDGLRKDQSSSALNQVYWDALNAAALDDGNTKLVEHKIASIKKEVEKLPAKCKQVFLLSKQEGLTNLEIAEHLNISIKSVEGHITNAYTIIRKNTQAKVKTSNLVLLFYSLIRQ